jgi:hypothetical protein
VFGAVILAITVNLVAELSNSTGWALAPYEERHVVGDGRIRGVGGELAQIASASVPKASV